MTTSKAILAAALAGLLAAPLLAQEDAGDAERTPPPMADDEAAPGAQTPTTTEVPPSTPTPRATTPPARRAETGTGSDTGTGNGTDTGTGTDTPADDAGQPETRPQP